MKHASNLRIAILKQKLFLEHRRLRKAYLSIKINNNIIATICATDVVAMRRVYS